MPPAHTRRGRAPADALRAGPRVYIRHACPADAPPYMALREESRRFLQPWEGRPPRGELWNDPARTLRQFADAKGERREALLVLRRGDDAILGLVGVSEIVRGIFQNAYIGYWIGERFAGQGYMREALATALDYVFLDMKLHRVEANIQPTNEPSRALARTLGFRCEGYSPRYLKINGAWRDHERWAMTSEEWRAARREVHARLRETPAAARRAG